MSRRARQWCQRAPPRYATRMKRIVRLHRYLSLFVAPAMLFFALSGAWQAFRLHQERKSSSYRPPEVVKALSQLHMAEKLPAERGVWFRYGQALLAAAFSLTALLGIWMGIRNTRPAWAVWVCLLAGALLPILLTFAVRTG